MFTHLHVRSWFSFRSGGSSPHALACRAAALGHDALALTDRDGLYGAVRFQKACREQGIKPIVGAEATVEQFPLVLLAASRDGYANLCRLLTAAQQRDRDNPSATFDELCDYSADLFCLTGGRASTIGQHLAAGAPSQARQHLRRLKALFGDRLSLEVSHHLLPDETERLQQLARLGRAVSVPLLATGNVRYAAPPDYKRYDLLRCIRDGLQVFESAPQRPRNAEAYLKPEATLRRLIPYGAAFERAEAVAAACTVDLLPEQIAAPASRLSDGDPPATLHRLCQQALQKKYPPHRRSAAARQMHSELTTITRLRLADFFLVVHEIIQEARRRSIRCAGRGSAANSIVAYLLDITAVDPLEHNLLFERFLHGGRKGTPDIDVDFDSSRRDEIIDWMEERFGISQTAMTATVVMYRLRSALRDVAKAFGWSLDEINDLTAAVPRRNAGDVYAYRERIERQLGASPLCDTLIDMVASLDGCPRHLGLHSGGMVLSHAPLARFTPVQTSANGVRMVQFDKDDIEALGLVKFDALGLRMLATLSEAEELIHRHHDATFDVDDLPLDDIRTFNLIRAGQTLGVFQIESQGQLHLLAQHQPETFRDLINEVALFRPGPLQGNMVHPFIRRRRGEEKVTFDHPDLEPILRDTYGIVLFQEQVLEIAHQFAGMSLAEADDFRALMSKFRHPDEMEKMRDRFVGGAVDRGVRPTTAHHVFDTIAHFVGYGFCRSHAAAFAKTVYQSAYLKTHFPAAYLAAVMQHRPGMYSLMTLEEEARRFGVALRPPDVHRSGLRYDLERVDSTDAAVPSRSWREGRGWAIRKPLPAIKHVSADDAAAIMWERLTAPFESVEDLYRRVPLGQSAFEGLARSGALDALASSSRGALWEIGLLQRRIGRPGRQAQARLFDVPAVRPADVPDLPSLTTAERYQWDYETHGAARRHPMTLRRRALQDLEVRPIATCDRFGRYVSVQKGGPHPLLTVAGLVILRQKPSSANGVMFITLEDETGFVQCVVRPAVQAHLGHVLERGALIVRGELHIEGNWRGLLVKYAWALNGIFGGYVGHPSASGGRDRQVLRPKDAAQSPSKRN
jgi:error-prone DNA polymerase